MIRRNKKGSLDDLVYIAITLLGAGMLILLFGKFSSEFNSQIQTLDEVPTAGKTAVSQIDDLYGGVIDNSFLFLAIGLAVAALIFAFLVVIHPIFFVFYFIMLGVVVYVSGVMSNIYQTAASEAVLADVAAKLIFTSHILEYLPVIVGVFGFVLAIIMYKTWQERV